VTAKNKKKKIPPRFQDQAGAHRLHRSEQSQYPDEGGKGNLEEAGQGGGERNPRDVRGNEGGSEERTESKGR
jgi:hypothetical protein